VPARPLQYARYGIYALLLLWEDGQTSQGLPVRVKFSKGRVVDSRLTYGAHCPTGERLNWQIDRSAP
jgi:hypothetical protein